MVRFFLPVRMMIRLRPRAIRGNKMILDPECEAILLRASRLVPDLLRDFFFAD